MQSDAALQSTCAAFQIVIEYPKTPCYMGMMEAIPTKIIATPEAYQLLTNPADGATTQSAVEEVVLAATHRRKSQLTDCYIINCPVSVHGRLTKTPEGEIFTILLYSKDGDGAMFFLFDEHYNAAVDSAVPIEIV